MKAVASYGQFKADRVYDINIKDPVVQVIRLLGQIHMDVAVHKRDVDIIVTGTDGYEHIGVSNTDEYYENFYNFYITLYRDGEPYEVRFASQPIPPKLPKDNTSHLMIELIYHVLLESGYEFIKTHKIQIVKDREQLLQYCTSEFAVNNYADFNYPFQYENDTYCFKLRKCGGVFDISIEGVDSGKALILNTEWFGGKEKYTEVQKLFRSIADRSFLSLLKFDNM